MARIKKEENIVPPPVKEIKIKKSRGTGKFFLGWFLGTIINLLIIVGLGFWSYYNVNISGLEKTFGFEIGILTEDAKHLSINKLIGKLTNVVTNYDERTIEELADGVGIDLYSILTVNSDGVNKTYKYKGLDVTAVIKGKLNEAADNMQVVLDDLSLGTIENLFGVNLPNYEFINSLKDTPLKDLASATTGLLDRYTLNKLSTEFGVTFTNVDMLKNFLDTTFDQLPEELNNLVVSDVIDTTGATGVLKAIAAYKINELDTKIQTLTIADMFETSEIESNIVLKNLKTSKLSTLAEDINGITVAELYPDATNKVLIALGPYAVTNLTAAFDSLKISDVIDIEKELNTSYVEGVDPTYKQYNPQGIWAYIPDTTLLKDLENVNPDLAAVKLGELQYQGLVDEGLDLTKTLDGVAMSEYTLDGFLAKAIEKL